MKECIYAYLVEFQRDWSKKKKEELFEKWIALIELNWKRGKLSSQRMRWLSSILWSQRHWSWFLSNWMVGNKMLNEMVFFFSKFFVCSNIIKWCFNILWGGFEDSRKFEQKFLYILNLKNKINQKTSKKKNLWEWM